MPDFDDDGFYTDDDELGEDCDPGLIGDAENQLLDSIGKLVSVMKNNITFNENSDFEANLELLSRYTSHLIDLRQLSQEKENCSNEELAEKIQIILQQTTILNSTNIDVLFPEGIEESITKTPDSLDEGTDW